MFGGWRCLVLVLIPAPGLAPPALCSEAGLQLDELRVGAVALQQLRVAARLQHRTLAHDHLQGQQQEEADKKRGRGAL